MDWTGGLDWWTGKVTFMFSNDTHSPVELCGSPVALFLATYMVSKLITCLFLQDQQHSMFFPQIFN